MILPMRPILITLMICLSVLTASARDTYTVADVLNVHLQDASVYVFHANGHLNAEETMPTASPEESQDMQLAKVLKELKDNELVQVVLNTFYLIAFLSLFTGFKKVISTSRKSRLIKQDSYRKARLWHSNLKIMGILTFFSGFTALPLFLYSFYQYRRWRTQSIICPNCSSRMHRLGEKADNAYLTHSQNIEEKLGTVDYDVWVCGKCGAAARFPFYPNQEKYTACPSCGTIAYCTGSERILRKPTSTVPGEGVRIKHCLNCGYSNSEKVLINPDHSDAATGAGAASDTLSRGDDSGIGGGGTGGQ